MCRNRDQHYIAMMITVCFHDKLVIANKPAYSPCAPLLGCRLHASKAVISHKIFCKFINNLFDNLLFDLQEQMDGSCSSAPSLMGSFQSCIQFHGAASQVRSWKYSRKDLYSPMILYNASSGFHCDGY